jgi:hypothetical protein
MRLRFKFALETEKLHQSNSKHVQRVPKVDKLTNPMRSAGL